RPEDLLYFSDHFRKVSGVVGEEQSLLLYCYHQHATTHSVLEATIWPAVPTFLSSRTVCSSPSGTGGRQGCRLDCSISLVHFVTLMRTRSRASTARGLSGRPRVPIYPLFLIACVKLGFTDAGGQKVDGGGGGEFEDNLRLLERAGGLGLPSLPLRNPQQSLPAKSPDNFQLLSAAASPSF
ncbi:hypothetical protein P7K49_038951, partial [Saguinus oedipus]